MLPIGLILIQWPDSVIKFFFLFFYFFSISLVIYISISTKWAQKVFSRALTIS